MGKMPNLFKTTLNEAAKSFMASLPGGVELAQPFHQGRHDKLLEVLPVAQRLEVNTPDDLLKRR
jgi:hypothetical protein